MPPRLGISYDVSLHGPFRYRALPMAPVVWSFGKVCPVGLLRISVCLALSLSFPISPSFCLCLSLFLLSPLFVSIDLYVYVFIII